MKVREDIGYGTCEACEEKDLDLNVVTFDRAGKTVLICGACLEWAREVLALVDVKEAEA